MEQNISTITKHYRIGIYSVGDTLSVRADMSLDG